MVSSMPSPSGTRTRPRSRLAGRGPAFVTFVTPQDFLPVVPTFCAPAFKACSTPWGLGTPLAQAPWLINAPGQAVPFIASTPKCLSHWLFIGSMGSYSTWPMGGPGFVPRST